MELKDVVLSTIAELGEQRSDGKETPKSVREVKEEIVKNASKIQNDPERAQESMDERFVKEEREFLEHMRERILVLFEGFQSPNNKRVEAKIDLTLNFLEYLLASLDERIETLKKP